MRSETKRWKITENINSLRRSVVNQPSLEAAILAQNLSRTENWPAGRSRNLELTNSGYMKHQLLPVNIIHSIRGLQVELMKIFGIF
jgi:hypothetical protein